jgi:hypothetical protein
MKCTNATKFHRKSGVAKWRDLQFYGPVLEMFFSSRKQCAGPCSCESIALENDLCLYLFGRLFCAGVSRVYALRPSRSRTIFKLNGRTLPYDTRGGHGWFRSQ